MFKLGSAFEAEALEARLLASVVFDSSIEYLAAATDSGDIVVNLADRARSTDVESAVYVKYETSVGDFGFGLEDLDAPATVAYLNNVVEGKFDSTWLSSRTRVGLFGTQGHKIDETGAIREPVAGALVSASPYLGPLERGQVLIRGVNNLSVVGTEPQGFFLNPPSLLGTVPAREWDELSAIMALPSEKLAEQLAQPPFNVEVNSELYTPFVGRETGDPLRPEHLVVIERVTASPTITYEIVGNSAPDVVQARIRGDELVVEAVGSLSGSATIVLAARDVYGDEAVLSFTVDVASLAPSIDLDGDGNVSAFSDGLLLARYLFGFRGDSLIAGLTTEASRYRNSEGLVDRLEGFAEGFFDIDGSGRAEPLSDAVLAIRALLGFEGNALTAGALGDDATRTTSGQVSAYVNGIMPVQGLASETSMLIDQERQSALARMFLLDSLWDFELVDDELLET